MTTDGRRKLRVLFKLGLLISLPLTGYLWANMGTVPLTIAMSGVCVVMALGAEGLASAAESTLFKLKAFADADERGFNADVAAKEDKIRQMDRIVETLSNENHDLRGKLVSIHSEVQRMQEETAHLEVAAATDAQETTEAEQAADGTEADVTDINSMRTRR